MSRPFVPREEVVIWWGRTPGYDFRFFTFLLDWNFSKRKESFSLFVKVLGLQCWGWQNTERDFLMKSNRLMSQRRNMGWENKWPVLRSFVSVRAELRVKWVRSPDSWMCSFWPGVYSCLDGLIHMLITENQLSSRLCLTKVCIVFPVVRYGCESWTIKKAEC